MTTKYLGGFITKSPVAVSSSSASGIWTLDQAMQYNKAATWPGVSLPWGPMILNSATDGNGVAYPGSQSQYAAVSTIPTGINYAFNSGYHYFDITPGTFSIDIRGAEGSGTSHGRGAKITATLTVLTATRLIALIGNSGSGSYGGGGGTFLAMRNASSDIYTSATALLVAGGGGGGYSSLNSEADAGITTNSATTRRGASTTEYDGGAGFSAGYNPELYYNSTGGQGSAAAQHFVWGGRGGIATSCGAANGNSGGFGGGGGTCPAGGGGYVGGKAGGSGYGGGGGTSYRLSSDTTAYISEWSDAGYNGTNNGTSGLLNGYLSITKI